VLYGVVHSFYLVLHTALATFNTMSSPLPLAVHGLTSAAVLRAVTSLGLAASRASRIMGQPFCTRLTGPPATCMFYEVNSAP